MAHGITTAMRAARDGRLRVVVVDDETVSRAGLSAILSEDPSIDLIGRAANLDQAAQAVRRQQPECVLASIDGSSEDTVDELGQFITAIEAAVVLIVRDPSVQFVREARGFGAAGVISKTASAAAIRGAVHAAGAGASVFPRLPHQWGSPLPSEREQQIISRVMDGQTNDEIAGALGLSTHTVASHLRRCFIRYGVASRTELAMLAVREHWCLATPTGLSSHSGTP